MTYSIDIPLLETPIMENLKWVTQAISQQYEVQKQLFPVFVNITDELALEWEAALNELNYPSFNFLLSDKQNKVIRELDGYMLSISGPGNIQYWNNESLCYGPEWENMRRLASNILNEMK